MRLDRKELGIVLVVVVTPLAYLKVKFSVKLRVEIDRRVLTEAAKAVV